jgi:hypothetical protein
MVCREGFRRSTPVLAALLIAAAASCGGGSGPVTAVDAITDISYLDVTVGDPGDSGVARDPAGGEDLDAHALEISFHPDVKDDGNGLLTINEPCRSNGECLSGFCVEGVEGPVCTQPCVLECPLGWICRASRIGSDVVSLCLPPGADLCKPCKVDTQCSDGACITVGDGTFCGRDCREGACPAGFDCTDATTSEGAGRQCVPRSRACDCLVTQAGAERPCARQNQAGTCLGFETCDPETGWLCNAPVPMVEVCNGLDDNCNRLVDETFPELGAPCHTGLGECRREGAFRCVADGSATECGAVAGDIAEEACDYLDNDCDGQTDEDFRVEGGGYVDDHSCGNCYVDCTAIYTPARHHADGVCSDATGSPRCAYDCNSGWVDADHNPENGCELQIDPDGIYVATPANGGADGDPCGRLWDAPCATITAALAQAVQSGRSRILVSDGVYAENVVMVDGVSVLGGYGAATWQRDPGSNLTILQGTTPDSAVSPHRKAVVAVGITKATEFSGFTVYGENVYGQRPDGRGGNSYAFHVRDCGPGLVIRDGIVISGRGAPGTTGANGSRGPNGPDGAGGAQCTASGVVGACAGVTSAGGAAGASECGVSGGRGADSVCAAGIVQMPSGGQGSGAAAGLGGAGGWSDTVSAACLVCHSDGQVDFGFDGGRGGSGGTGTAGAGCTDANGQISGGEWLSETAGAGTAGVAGSGGGGGGGGAGVDLDVACGYDDRVGSAGGGGGAGGCGGLGGEAGRGGGASIGLFVINTTGVAGLVPVVRDLRVVRNHGGPGGQGGSGGTGGVGGSGGGGGSVDCAQNAAGNPYWFKVCIGKGGTGGDGGIGGAGGGGGGGCGGPSWGILGVGVAGDVPDWCTPSGSNVFGALGSGGPGGAGGNSAGQTGTAGAAGDAADCRIQ